jgi:hypothetical protein
MYDTFLEHERCMNPLSALKYGSSRWQALILAERQYQFHRKVFIPSPVS